MPAYLIQYPKGQGADTLVEDEHLNLTISHGWAVLADQHGTCIAIPAHTGATITRIDSEDTEPEGEAAGSTVDTGRRRR